MFIYWGSWMTVLLLLYHSSAPCSLPLNTTYSGSLFPEPRPVTLWWDQATRKEVCSHPQYGPTPPGPYRTSIKGLVLSSHKAHGAPGFVRWRTATTARTPPASNRFSVTRQTNDDGLIRINPSDYHSHTSLPVLSVYNSQTVAPEFSQPTSYLGCPRVSSRPPRSLFHPVTGYRCHFTVGKPYRLWPWSPQASLYESPVPDTPSQLLSAWLHSFIYLETLHIPILNPGKPVSKCTSFRPILSSLPWYKGTGGNRASYTEFLSRHRGCTVRLLTSSIHYLRPSPAGYSARHRNEPA